MTDTKPQFVSNRPTLRAALVLPAAALIFLGSMFQLGVLGYGQIDPRHMWPAVMLFQAAWNLVAVHLNAPDLRDIFQYWPLLLIGSGVAILLALKSKGCVGARRQ